MGPVTPKVLFHASSDVAWCTHQHIHVPTYLSTYFEEEVENQCDFSF